MILLGWWLVSCGDADGGRRPVPTLDPAPLGADVVLGRVDRVSSSARFVTPPPSFGAGPSRDVSLSGRRTDVDGERSRMYYRVHGPCATWLSRGDVLLLVGVAHPGGPWVRCDDLVVARELDGPAFQELAARHGFDAGQLEQLAPAGAGCLR